MTDTATKGPIETIVHSPGFRRLWADFISDIQSQHMGLMEDACKAVCAGNDVEALNCLKRAAGIEEVLNMAINRPTTAVRHEREAAGALPPVEAPGYSGVS